MIPSDREFDVHNLLDVLWMARLVRDAPAGSVTPTDDAPAPAADRPPEEDSGPGPAPPVAPAPGTPGSDDPHGRATEAVLVTTPATTGVSEARHHEPVRRPNRPGDTPGVTGRALRPLRRKVSRQDRIVVDEDRTLRASADAGRPVVVTRPHTERWLDLALVVDASPTMGIWRQTVSRLKTVVRRSGVFRDVRIWRLVTGEDGVPALLTTGGQRHHPTELLDQTGRRLIALVTDGIDDRWHTDAAATMLSRWSADNPVIALQVLPPSLWHRTALPPAPIRPRQRRPGIWQPAAPGFAELTKAGWIPVAGVDDASIHRWASTMVSARISMTEMPAIPIGVLPLTTPSEAAPMQAEEAVELVALFHSNSSPTAFTLAGYLAAVPIALPVARAVQQDWLPDSDLSHLVEVLFSGLVERVSSPSSPDEDPDAVVYDFVPGVRRELLRTRRREEVFRVLHLLALRSPSIAGPLGTVNLFELAERPGDYLNEYPDSRQAAKVAVAVLGGFGGVYADLAVRLQVTLEEAAGSGTGQGTRPSIMIESPPGPATGAHWINELEPLDGGRIVASLAQWVEVHRLAVAGGEAVIARDVGHQVARLWLRTSRFTDVMALAQTTLTLGPDADTLVDMGLAESSTGRPREALNHLEMALTLYREVGDRAGEAAALNDIAFVHNSLGDHRQARDFSQLALTIHREVGDRAGEAAALNNIGYIYDSLGDHQQALDYYQQALPLRREVGDRAGEGTTLNNISSIYNGLGDHEQALAFSQSALTIQREVGDRAGEAAALNTIGAIYRNLGDQQRAIIYYQQALPIRQEIGDRFGEAITLSGIGAVWADLNNVDRAMDSLVAAIEIFHNLADRNSEATARFNLAVLLSRKARVDDAAEHLRRSVALAEETSHPSLGRIQSFLDELQPTSRK